MPDTSNTLRPAPTAIAQAVTAMDILVQRDPVEALSVADRHRHDPNRPAAERAVDEWAAGRSELELGDAERAVASLRRAVALATDGAVDRADRPLVARFRISLALALAELLSGSTAVSYTHLTLPTILLV